MIYEFGDYKVKTIYNKGNFFDLESWKQTTYFKDSPIYRSKWHSTETGALKAAQYEIGRHKALLNWMNNHV